MSLLAIPFAVLFHSIRLFSLFFSRAENIQAAIKSFNEEKKLLRQTGIEKTVLFDVLSICFY